MKPTTDLDLAKAYQRLKDLLSRIEELTGKSPLSEPAGAKCGTCGSVNCTTCSGTGRSHEGTPDCSACKGTGEVSARCGCVAALSDIPHAAWCPCTCQPCKGTGKATQ